MKLCPRCQQPLVTRAVSGIELDLCPGCAGIWFDESELTRLAKLHPGALCKLEDAVVPRKAVSSTAPEGAGLCPNCGSALFSFEFRHAPGVKLDGCRSCKGLWVDDGELRGLTDRRSTSDDTHQRRAKGGAVRAAVGLLVRVPCPVCGEDNPSSALVCWACQAVLKGRRGAMLCPQCSGRLVSSAWGELSLDKCQACGGVWMDDASLSRLLGEELFSSPEPLPDNQHAATARFALLEAPGGSAGTSGEGTRSEQKLCPLCSAPLRPFQYAYSSGILLDKCQQCQGVWVDAGELEGIRRYLLNA